MATRTLNKFVNKVSWVNDLQSWNKVKKQIKSYKKEIDSLYKKIPPPPIKLPIQPELDKPSRQKRNPRQEQDGHVNLYRKQLAMEEKIDRYREQTVNRFIRSNELIRKMNKEERDKLVTQIRQEKTIEGIRNKEKDLRNTVLDGERARKRSLAVLNQQNLAQRRLTSSTEQMVGALASVYTAAAAGNAIMQVGIQFEAIEKSFIVVSGGAEAAAKDFAFVREEAMRLGAPLGELSESFARMRAAAGDKMGLDDLKGVFVGVNEAAVALGLTQEKVSKVMLATQQMMSKDRIMAEELN